MTFDAFIKNYMHKGLIKKQKPDFHALDTMVSRAFKEIDIAKATIAIDEGTAFTAAYNAMLHAGRALILSKGYRPSDKAQHKTVVDFAAMYLGKEFQAVTLHFEKARKKRHRFMYEVTISISDLEVHTAITSALKLIRAIRTILINENPQYHFSF